MESLHKVFLELVSKRKHAVSYIKPADVYHWAAVPVEWAEHFTGVRFLGEVYLSSLE